MDEIVEQAKAQLMMIEQIYGLKIINRNEVAGLIAANVAKETCISWQVNEGICLICRG